MTSFPTPTSLPTRLLPHLLTSTFFSFFIFSGLLALLSLLGLALAPSTTFFNFLLNFLLLHPNFQLLLQPQPQLLRLLLPSSFSFHQMLSSPRFLRSMSSSALHRVSTSSSSFLFFLSSQLSLSLSSLFSLLSSQVHGLLKDKTLLKDSAFIAGQWVAATGRKSFNVHGKHSSFLCSFPFSFTTCLVRIDNLSIWCCG